MRTQLFKFVEALSLQEKIRVILTRLHGVFFTIYLYYLIKFLLKAN